MPFPYPVAPLILSHHERWDGKGYPHGLKGEEIPLGARILAVVDYFDALMSRAAVPQGDELEAAVGLLRQEAGKALDPHVVEQFIELLPTLLAAAERSRAGGAPAADRTSRVGDGRPAAGSSGRRRPRRTCFEDIALAHREIYALYEIAQAMGTQPRRRRTRWRSSRRS